MPSARSAKQLDDLLTGITFFDHPHRSAELTMKPHSFSIREPRIRGITSPARISRSNDRKFLLEARPNGSPRKVSTRELKFASGHPHHAAFSASQHQSRRADWPPYPLSGRNT